MKIMFSFLFGIFWCVFFTVSDVVVHIESYQYYALAGTFLGMIYQEILRR